MSELSEADIHAAAAVFKSLLRGECPYHHKKVRTTKIGRCIYAVECGCRLYQGALGAFGWQRDGAPTVAGHILPPPAADSG